MTTKLSESRDSCKLWLASAEYEANEILYAIEKALAHAPTATVRSQLRRVLSAQKEAIALMEIVQP